MNLIEQQCVGQSTEIVDTERDGGEGRPLIVARTYDDDVKRLLLAGPLMLEALLAVEWAGQDDAPEGGYVNACPFCGNAKPAGHALNCQLNEAIATADINA